MLITALILTLLRLITAYLLAIIVAIPLALLATENKTAERILLPIFDILESIPVLAFFPLFIIFFLKINFANGAAIFILFLSMLWNIVFTLVGGLKMIPKDINYAGKVFNIKGFDHLRYITLPAIVPEIITGSILAFAQGWNLIIVAEVLHTYVPGMLNSGDLLGIGSVLVNSFATGDNHTFIASIVVMIATIGFLNIFVWQKLIDYAEKYKFE
jgi:NitT/TauT family transport system permease protein